MPQSLGSPGPTPLETAVARLRAEPRSFPSVAALAREAGLGAAALVVESARQFHAAPAELLLASRLAAARRLLVETERSLDEVAADCGFADAVALATAFVERLGLGAEAFRALRGASSFTLRLPTPYPLDRFLRYWGRDLDSATERVRGPVYELGTMLPGGPARLELRFGSGRVAVSLKPTQALEAGDALAAHGQLVRRLGLDQDPAPFEAAVAELAGSRPLLGDRAGLRLPLTLEPFEAIPWVVLGTQVNLAFTFKLFRRLAERAGFAVGDGLFTPPRPERILEISAETLRGDQLSTRKAEYLLEAARQVASGELDLEALRLGSAERAEARLLAVRGLGVWSTRYILMRGLGFADSVPIGDAGLVRALARWLQLGARPDAKQTEALMARFAPHRSLATFHLWLSLADPAEGAA